MDTDFFKNIRILDGGMGQQLLAKGLISKGTLWSASANLDKKFHDLVVDVHLSFINAGSEVILTNTFSARKIRLIQNKVDKDFVYINEQACLLSIKAKEKSGKDVLIAGSLPCQNDTYVEDQRDSKELEKAFYEQAEVIAPYVDFFYLDVVSSGREIDIASNVAVKLNKTVLLGIHVKKNNLLPSNETITEVLNKYRSNNWLGVITACVSPKIAEECTSEIKKLDIPFGFKANLWKVEEPTPVQTFNKAKPDEIGTNPNVTLGKRDNNSAKKFYDFSKRLVEQGATIILIPLVSFIEQPWQVLPRTDSLISVIYLGIVPTGIAWLLRFKILKDNGLIFQSQVSYLIPIFGTILGYIFLKELITIKVLISLTAVCIGIYFVRRADRKKLS